MSIGLLITSDDNGKTFADLDISYKHIGIMVIDADSVIVENITIYNVEYPIVIIGGENCIFKDIIAFELGRSNIVGSYKVKIGNYNQWFNCLLDNSYMSLSYDFQYFVMLAIKHKMIKLTDSQLAVITILRLITNDERVRDICKELINELEE